MNATTNLRTAAEYRALADDARRESAASWDRSDTDGYLSQWANDTMASRYLDLARIAENGGHIDQLALFYNGELASEDQRSGQYGLYWVLNDTAAAAFGKRFYSPSKARKSVAADRKRGFTFGTLRAQACENPRSGRAEMVDGPREVVCTDGAYADIEAGENA